MLDHRFSYEMFAAATDSSRERLADELAEELVKRVHASPDPAKAAHGCIEDLKSLGHDLWSFDESDDFQDWCGNWTASMTPFELIVGFRYPEQQAPTVSVAFKPSKSAARR